MLRRVLTRDLPALCDQVVVAAMLIATAIGYASRHDRNPQAPHALGVTGWWTWNDQGLYLRAVGAWVSGVLDPAQHWYFPGYPLLGAAFAWATPTQPFYLPDLLCLLAYAWLFVRLAESLAPHTPAIRIIGAAIFTGTVLMSRLMMKSFVEPWTTTPTAPITLATILLLIRFADRPTPRRALLLGLVSVSTLWFRPTEAIILVAVTAPCAGLSLLHSRPGWAPAGRMVAVAAAGAAIPALLFAGVHAMLYGWQLSDYTRASQGVGFEWALVPLRWVTIFIAPEPLFPDGMGLIHPFPWIVPGVAGMLACLAGTRGRLLTRHAIVVSTVLVHCVVYLAYRDLHPQGLFLYSNYHYFKWLIPVFGLYAVLLVAVVVALPRRWPAWAIGFAVTAALFSWRAEWHPGAPGYAADDGVIEPPRTLLLRHGLHSVADGVRVASDGNLATLFHGVHQMHVGSSVYWSNIDIKAFPEPGGFILTLLRPIPPGEAVIAFDQSVTLDGAVTPVFGRQAIVFAWTGAINQARMTLARWRSGEPKSKSAAG